MPLQVAAEKCKRQQSEQQPRSPLPQPKRQKLSQSTTTYWDNLSTIWLTKSALRELDRRNSIPISFQNHHRPVTRRLHAERNRHLQPFKIAPDFLDDCGFNTLKQIRRLSRLGGPDLSDLRNYSEPANLFDKPMCSRIPSSRGKKRHAESSLLSSSSTAKDTKGTTRTTSTTAYSRNFQQNLIDHGVYPDGYEYPDGRIPVAPNNWEEINERLARRRPSLSPSNFSDGEFRKFKRADTHASKEKPVTTTVIPLIDGDIGDPKCVGGDYLFGNLAPLTDGSLANAKPDHFFGARPEQLNLQTRNELSDRIIPSTQSDLPIIPNFSLEVKGPDGPPVVATRQACYDGALGARGIHSLQSYKQEEYIYDNKAYTVVSTYQAGQLKLYTTHPTAPRESDGRPEYIMTSLRSFAMTDNLDTFRSGASAYRNARDWAKEQRDKFIKAANERYMQARPELPSISEYEFTFEPTINLEDSVTSITSDEAVFHDDNVEDRQALSKYPKRARTRTNLIESASSMSPPN